MDSRSTFRRHGATTKTVWGDVHPSRSARGWKCALGSVGGRAGKSARQHSETSQEAKLRPSQTDCGVVLEKPLPSRLVSVPQTDTGRQAENAQARERTLVKELGKIAP